MHQTINLRKISLTGQLLWFATATLYNACSLIAMSRGNPGSAAFKDS